MEIGEILARAKEYKLNVVRRPVSMTFGDRATCEQLFRQLFVVADGSVRDFVMLPEYEQVIDWMTDTGGKGLCLWGDCGRGKSTIVTGVIPLLLLAFNRVARPELAQRIPDRIAQLLEYGVLCLDEVGVETQVSNFGERYEGFNALINAAESRLKPVFMTTNLKPEQLLDRYGERTVERVKRLCRLVHFSGESLRR